MQRQSMSKFYVESGPHLQCVVQAINPLQAILKVLDKTDDTEPLRLADLFIVSRRGFVWDRPGRRLDGDETVLPTQLLLGDPEEQAEACPTAAAATPATLPSEAL